VTSSLVHVPTGSHFEFHVQLDPAGVLGRMLDHPRVLAVGIPDPRRDATRSVPGEQVARSREFDTNAIYDDAPRFNLTRVRPDTYRVAVLEGARVKGSAERVVTIQVHAEGTGSHLICNLRRFSGPADAASALGRGMLSGFLVMTAVFVDPGTVIGGVFWQVWEGGGRVVRRLTGRQRKGDAPPPPPPSTREALVALLGELFTPVSRAIDEAPPTPFRA